MRLFCLWNIRKILYGKIQGYSRLIPAFFVPEILANVAGVLFRLLIKK